MADVRKITVDGFDRLLAELDGRGYDLIGQTVRHGVVVLERISSAADLAGGVVDYQEAGVYHLLESGRTRLFDTSCGPESAKRLLFPPREPLATVRRVERSLSVEEAPIEARPVAIVGLRSCDLHAVQIQDAVFLGGRPDRRYGARRNAAFLVGVDCARAGPTCFCTSMGTGPACTTGFDIALTELESGDLLIRAGTTAGKEVLAVLPTQDATRDDLAEAAAVEARTARSMGREVDSDGLRDLLYRNLDHPRWGDVAERCLACGNCTAVCPTCFCHDVVDTAGLKGDAAERSREWASCFSLEYSHLAGHDVRAARHARYRQWATHKFAGWVDQFGTSGCVGCGRCITWCPVGIDITAELAAIRDSDGEVAQ